MELVSLVLGGSSLYCASRVLGVLGIGGVTVLAAVQRALALASRPFPEEHALYCMPEGRLWLALANLPPNALKIFDLYRRLVLSDNDNKYKTAADLAKELALLFPSNEERERALQFFCPIMDLRYLRYQRYSHEKEKRSIALQALLPVYNEMKDTHLEDLRKLLGKIHLIMQECRSDISDIDFKMKKILALFRLMRDNGGWEKITSQEGWPDHLRSLLISACMSPQCLAFLIEKKYSLEWMDEVFYHGDFSDILTFERLIQQICIFYPGGLKGLFSKIACKGVWNSFLHEFFVQTKLLDIRDLYLLIQLMKAPLFNLRDDHHVIESFCRKVIRLIKENRENNYYYLFLLFSKPDLLRQLLIGEEGEVIKNFEILIKTRFLEECPGSEEDSLRVYLQECRGIEDGELEQLMSLVQILPPIAWDFHFLRALHTVPVEYRERAARETANMSAGLVKGELIKFLNSKAVEGVFKQHKVSLPSDAEGAKRALMEFWNVNKFRFKYWSYTDYEKAAEEYRQRLVAGFGLGENAFRHCLPFTSDVSDVEKALIEFCSINKSHFPSWGLLDYVKAAKQFNQHGRLHKARFISEVVRVGMEGSLLENGFRNLDHKLASLEIEMLPVDTLHAFYNRRETHVNIDPQG